MFSISQMNSQTPRQLRRASLSLALGVILTFSPALRADEANNKPLPTPPATTGDWYLSFSPYMHHWYHKPEHENVVLAGIERYDADKSFMGTAVFRNSYGDPTIYIYPWGQTYPNFLGYEKLAAKWSAGLLYGYVGQWANKVPFNHNGFSPAIIPALSWKLGGGYEFQLNFPTFNVMFALQIPLRIGER
jgi:hypothetical protein